MRDRVTLLTLREQCAATIATIDRALGQLPEPLTPDPRRQPLVVPGVCTEITAHAIERFRERTGTKKGEISTLNRMRERLERAERWRLKEKFRLIELLAHGNDSDVWRDRELVFIIESGVVITVHLGTADRWEKMPAPSRPVAGIPATVNEGSMGNSIDLKEAKETL